MPDPSELPQGLAVSPPLAATERAVVASFGPQADVRRLWAGQPHGRSPWASCADGCCLDLALRSEPAEAVAWLRFLLREVLSPRAVASARRTAAAGLPGGHRVDGRVLVGESAPVLVTVAASRVHEVRLDDDHLPLEPRSRSRCAEVVALREGPHTER